jgi:hypothetical protein
MPAKKRKGVTAPAANRVMWHTTGAQLALVPNKANLLIPPPSPDSGMEVTEENHAN